MSKSFSLKLVGRILIAALVVASFQLAPKAAVAGEQGYSDIELNAEIERQVEALLIDLKKQNPDIPENVLEKIHRQAYYRFKQVSAVTDIVKASGKAPAAALVAGEVVPTLIAAPIFAYLGYHTAAAAALTVPWGIMAGAGTLAIQYQKQRIKIARQLGRKFYLGDLERLRKSIIGYDIKHRVSTAVFMSLKEMGDRDFEFDILKKTSRKAVYHTPYVTADELVAMVESLPEGNEYLDQIYFQRMNKELYVAMLAVFLSSSAQGSERLSDVLKARTPVNPETTPRLRDQFIAIDEAKKKVARDIRAIQEEIKVVAASSPNGTILKRIKNIATGTPTGFPLTDDRAKAIIEELKEEIERLLAVRQQITNHEYALLLEVKSAYLKGDADKAESIAEKSIAALDELRNHAQLGVMSYVPRNEGSNLPQGVFGLRCHALFTP